MDTEVSIPLWARLALNDISVRYRRSVLGPFWITATMLVFVVTVGFLYSGLFAQPSTQFLHHLAIGLVFWQFLSGCVNEGAGALINDKNMLLNTTISPFDIIMRVVARNFIIMLHNLPILVLTFAYAWPVVGLNFFIFMIGGTLVLLNAIWITIFVAIISARFRDIPPFVAVLTQLLFILSPIIWMSDRLPQKSAIIIFNPIGHIIDAVRSPLMDGGANYLALGVSATIAALGCLFAYVTYHRFKYRLAYWV